MKKRKDVFNSGNPAYDTFVNGLYTQVNTNKVAWGIDAALVTAILALLTIWNNMWAISKNKTTSTSTDRSNTRTARINLTAYLRPFVQKEIFLNLLMTDADIIACGLDPKDKVRTPIGAPTTEPDMDYKVTGTHQIGAHYRQEPGEDGVSKRAKPAGVGSIKVAYHVGDNPPANPDDFSKSVIGTRTPVKVSFNPADAGKMVTFAGQWISKSNLPGGWSDNQDMIVP